MREFILEGLLELPSKQQFISALGHNYASIADTMFQAMWRSYLKNKSSINLTYWADRFNNPKVFNIVLMSLSKAGWIVSHSIPARNWSEAHLNENKLLQYCTQEELEHVRAYCKFRNYMPTASESATSNRTRLNGVEQDTGLNRPGFSKAGNSKYKIDTSYLDDYYLVIKQNTTKSMDKIKVMYPEMTSDAATYDTISVDTLDYHIANPDQVYTTGENVNDSRGRAISDCLGKVFNPISFKDARALLVIGE